MSIIMMESIMDVFQNKNKQQQTKTAKKIPCDTIIIFTQNIGRQDIEEMPSGESQFPGYNISHVPGMRMKDAD